MQTAMRVILLVASIGIIFGLAAPAAAATSCDGECLREIMTKYLDAVIAHNPKGLPLAHKTRAICFQHPVSDQEGE